MPRTDYQRLIDRGRKAGLGTPELYRALGARRPEVGDQLCRTDGNGFVNGYGSKGERIIRPSEDRPPS
jgi:hypothetical protein